jgi:ferrochelatase
VICPAFVADCLETVDEVDRDVRAAFIGAGGEQFDLIPCLNDDPGWVAALVEMAQESASVM